MTGLRFHVSETSLGWVAVALTDAGLRFITLPRATQNAAMHELIEIGASEPATPDEVRRIDAFVQQLTSGRPVTDPIPIDWSGMTPFRKAVLEECSRIPAGETRSYGWLAAQVGRPGAARAVGRVMATNPWPLLVPCHRVVRSSGHLHGYGGGLEMKAALLKIEGAR